MSHLSFLGCEPARCGNWAARRLEFKVSLVILRMLLLDVDEPLLATPSKGAYALPVDDTDMP